MYLKKLTLFGFKSFADKTVLNFDSGITCIVGPNGCGKSNISDAFRWVLGEQSAKSLRGAKMPDIIFAGTNSRKPLNYAEVSLTLTDIQNALPIDYEEITITRRLHRDGESQYLINDQPVRLKDVQMLFLDSGIGKDAFSIFEQGKLDQIISFTPIERRYIFEEAAGILRFLQRKKESLKRLEQADLNLNRLQDIHREVQTQIQTLEEQAEKARAYKDNQNLLSSLEMAAIASKWQIISSKLESLKEKEELTKNLLAEAEQHQFSQAMEIHEIKEQLQLSEKTLRTLSENLLKLKGENELEQRSIKNHEQRIAENEQRCIKLIQSREQLAINSQRRKQLFSDLNAKMADLEKEWATAETSWAGKQESVKEKEQEVTLFRKDLFHKQQHHLKAVHQNSQWNSDLKQAEVRLEHDTEKHKAIEERLKKFQTNESEFAELIAEKREALLTISDIVETHKDNFQRFEDQILELSHEIQHQQDTITHLRKKIVEDGARKKVLLKMKEDLEGFSTGTKRLLKETKNPQSELFNKLSPLYEAFDPSPTIAEALAIVMRTYSQTLVVDNSADFNAVVQFAEKENLQDYSLICKEWLKTPKKKSSVLESIWFSHLPSSPLAEHFLQETAFFPDKQAAIDQCKNQTRLQGWSEDGSFIDYLGVFFKIKPGENLVFLRESELKQLEDDLNIQQMQVEKEENLFLKAQQKRSQIQAERAEIDQMLRRDEMKLVEARFLLQKLNGELEKNKQDQELCKKECAHLLEQLADQNKRFKELHTQFVSSTNEVNQLQLEKEAMQQLIEEKEELLKIQLDQQKEASARYRQLTDLKQKLIHETNLLQLSEENDLATEEKTKTEIVEIEELQKKLRADKADLEKKSLLIQKQLKELFSENESANTSHEAIVGELHSSEKKLFRQQEECKKINQASNQLQIDCAQLITAKETIEAECLNRYQITPEQTLHHAEALKYSKDELEKTIRSVKNILQESGNVNLAAIEELEKHQVRFSFLKQQVDDMEISKTELLEIIKKLDTESRCLLESTFEAIRNNFKKNFQILFEGGEADLQFTESDDILQAGVEIIAKPPGKQMRSISLLSGGEKCLTAVALLFAIFEVKPAPFCILDEIDAPLDDSNVDRFVNVVKHFAAKCQFLIISHNKRTMSISDTLFGISMQERGVSKLLSLEFANREIPEASLV